MLSKSMQRKATLYLVSMIFLHCFVMFKSWEGIRIGLPDFSIFYTAGRILHDGHGSQLYDNGIQEAVQRSFSPGGVGERGSILPYNHPPFEALLFVPLVRFSYLTAYGIWFAVNISLLLIMVLVLRKYFANLGKVPVYLWILASFGFYPIFSALMQGQDSILVLFCYCMAYVALRKESEFRAGGWLGLGLCKFHLIIPFVLPLLLRWRKRFLTGFASVAIISTGIGLATVGWHELLNYPRYVWQSEQNQSYRWNLSSGNTPSLHGMIGSLPPLGGIWMKGGLLIVFSGVLLAGAVHAWKRAQTAGVAGRDLAFASSLLVTVLVSYHLYAQDLSMLFLAILLIGEVEVSTKSINPWLRRTILFCIAILFCSPVYLALILRYQQLELIAVVLLVLFVGLLSLQSAVGSEAARLPASVNR
jgi:Glycosyltransferase family 87